MASDIIKHSAGTICAIALAITAVSKANATEHNANAQFKALYTREWKWREQQMGRGEQAGHRNVQDHLPKVDATTQAMRLTYWRNIMKQLNAISYNQLSPKEKVNYDVYRPQIETLINQERFHDYEMPVNADTSFWGNVSATARGTFRSRQDYVNWISQMRDIPRYFHEQIANMRVGEKRGFIQPKVTLVGRDTAIDAVTNKNPEKTLFYKPFKTMLLSIPMAEQAKLRAKALQVIRDDVQPAYAALFKFMHDEYIPHARSSIAAYDLPNGKAYYRAKIKEFTTLDMTPKAIHKLGVAKVAKLHQQMIDVMHKTGFKDDFAKFQRNLRTDPKFYAKTPLEYLKDAAWIAKEFDGKAARFFGHLPRMRFAIKPVPADIAPFYTSGRGGPGVYLVNTYDLAHRPLYNLTAMTLHESAPGHAFQMPLAMEDKSLPDFRRYTYISAYGEGWAVYCEWLGQEMNMYKTPYEQYGMLGWQIWRAARLVVDTGIHSEGWTRAHAIKYLHHYTTLPDHEIKTEVDRYIAWPGQALSYYLGEIAIRKDRVKAEKVLGSKFNIRAFHDTVLALGSVPLPVLNKHIDQFIAKGGVGPYPDEE